ncbi:protein arginine N-methyltransferase 7 [Impatiens glandulifera]|uniref:protein arginine N-methyltransferase 7 n=1 Tax=Impatiens glandulifera TaxID=253017 RepID=UPI001FB0EC91|nr:protein arginine N-methyltransferase 7 [Impatiens glandulifera]
MHTLIHKVLKNPAFSVSSTHKTLSLIPHPFACCIKNQVRNMSSGRMFQLRLDPLTGNSEWVVIEDEREEMATAGATKHLLAPTSYLDMLNDSRRNRAYREAIDKTVTNSCHVLDIGAGTGLLSMMAARAMESNMPTVLSNSVGGTVTACESYLPMVKLMRKTLRINEMERKVHIFHKRSDELQVGIDIPSKADVLVSEILDSELLGEGLIPSLQHAYDRLLQPNPKTVPYRATTYGQLVECNYLWKLHDLLGNEMNVLDDIQLVPMNLKKILNVKSQRFDMHCDAIRDEIKLLSEPFKIFEFDFWRRPESRGEVKINVTATNNGTAHALISWWVLQLDSEGTIFYSTAPKYLDDAFPDSADWCDHWKQSVSFIPERSVSNGEEVLLHATHTDITTTYKLESRDSFMSEIELCSDVDRQFQILLSPERVAIYRDNDWRSSMLKAVKYALQLKGETSPLCVVADDSLFLTIAIANSSKEAQIVSLFPGLQRDAVQYLQAVASANGYSKDQIKVHQKCKSSLTIYDDACQKKVDILIAEPFYFGNEGMLPWQNLRFWKERTLLDPILSDDVTIMPWKGLLKARAMSLPDLWRSRCSLKDVEGFDHSCVNSVLGACGDLPAPQEGPVFPFFIWQCGRSEALSEEFTVMEFDFSQPMAGCSGKAKVEYTKPGICHGLVFWIDWVMDRKNSIVISTGPDERYWKQAVKLFSKPVAVGSNLVDASAEVEATFEPSTADLCIRYTAVQ